MDKKPSFENLFPGTNESGLIPGPGVTGPLHHAGVPNFPRGTTAADYVEPEPVPAWEADIEENALSDALNYLRNNPNISSLDTILICRWPVTRARALEIISQARSVIASDTTAPVDLDGCFRKK